MFFVIGAAAILVGTFVCAVSDRLEYTRLEWVVGVPGIMLVVFGICSVLYSIGTLAWRYLP